MTINSANLEIRLSGGAANTDQNLSLGGVMSSERVLSQSAVPTTAIPGITLDYAGGNTLGNGTLEYTFATNSITWLDNGNMKGSDIDISVDGKYAISSFFGGQVHITVVAASLPGADLVQGVAVSNIVNETFDDVTKAESSSGSTDYRAFFITNTHATESFTAAKVFLKSDASGPDSLTIGLDPAGLNADAPTIANETTAPSGVTFTAPGTAALGLDIGALAPGDRYTFWERRTVPSGVSSGALSDVSRLGIEVTY